MTEFSGESPINHVSGVDVQPRFKVGDRVKYVGTRTLHLIGAEGVVIDGTFSASKVPVRWDALPESLGVYPHNIELVTRKDTPRVGDIVRVVLEGKVALESTQEKGGFSIAGADLRTWVYPEQGNVSSVEIITPAKPSVSDLPVGSALRDVEGIVFVKVGANMPKPWADQWGRRHADADVDLFDWTLLVEKSNG